MEHMGSDKLYFYLLTTIFPQDFFVQTFIPEGGGSFWGGSEDSHAFLVEVGWCSLLIVLCRTCWRQIHAEGSLFKASFYT